MTALKGVRISELQREMMNIHYMAPEHTLTAMQMARALGYPHHSVANSNYGKLGHVLGKALNWTPPTDSDLGVAVLCTFVKPENNWHWIMRPEVIEALERLGWVNPSTISLPEEIAEPGIYFEGAARQISINAYERNANARLACVKQYGYACAACGLSLENLYGEAGRNYIHVHHLRQLAEVGEHYEVDPVADLRPVCPNCHAIIHRKTPPYSIQEVVQMLKAGRTRTSQ